MARRRQKFQTTVMIAMFVLLTLVTSIGFSDDDHWQWRKPGVAPAENAIYREACGECHFAYPPGLLPEASWRKIMADLANHFSEDAQLDPQTETQLLDYLVNNSADQVNFRRSRSLMKKLGKDAAPMRFTETAFFRHEHDEVPAKMVKGNNEVGSFSNCPACHQRAEAGSFRESEISIAGFGKWDD